MKKGVFIFVIFLFFMGVVGAVDCNNDITDCCDITSSGEYTLMSDIEMDFAGSDVCINILSDGVTLNGNDKKISNTGDLTEGIGVRFSSESGGQVIIQNFLLTDLKYGIYVASAEDVKILKNQISGGSASSSANSGIYVVNSKTIEISENKIENLYSSLAAIQIFSLLVALEDINIHDNELRSNSGSGINLMTVSNSYVVDNTVVESGAYGINLFNPNNVEVSENYVYMSGTKDVRLYLSSEPVDNEVYGSENLWNTVDSSHPDFWPLMGTDSNKHYANICGSGETLCISGFCRVDDPANPDDGCGKIRCNNNGRCDWGEGCGCDDCKDRDFDQDSCVEYMFCNSDGFCDDCLRTANCKLKCDYGQKIGDVSGDGIIDDSDVMWAELIVLMGSSIAPDNICCADVDQNERVDAFDVTLINLIIDGDYPAPDPSICVEPPTEEIFTCGSIDDPTECDSYYKTEFLTEDLKAAIAGYP